MRRILSIFLCLLLDRALSKEDANEMFHVFDNILQDFEYEQKKIPSAAKIKKIQVESMKRYEEATKEAKVTFDASIYEQADKISAEILSIEKSLDESELSDIETAIADFNIPLLKERYATWQEQITNIKNVISKKKADAEAKAATDKAAAAAKKAADKAAALAAKERTFSAGLYTVDTDIPWGKYDIIAVSGQGNLFVRGGVLRINEIMGVDDPSFYVAKYSNAYLDKGQTIEIRGSLVLNFKPLEITTE